MREMSSNSLLKSKKNRLLMANSSTICIQDGDRGGSEEPTQAYYKYVEERRHSDNEGIRLKANWYRLHAWSLAYHASKYSYLKTTP